MSLAYSRLTARTPAGVTAADPAAALARLADLEDTIEALLRERGQISAELEALRTGGKTRTVRFRELLARKVTNRDMLTRLGVPVAGD